MTQPCDDFIDLDPRQLTALTGLGALGDLYLNLFTIVQIFGGNTKPTRCNLLDRARGVIAIFTKPETSRVFATLA